MCQTKYNCNFSLTIDEQLMPVKSRCPFITFMPNKPGKYRIKFWVLADIETKYVANIVPYLGAQERGGTPLAESVLVKFTEKVKEKGYNITCDNFFTLLSAAEKLACNKILIVGTIRKNHCELSPQMTQPMPSNPYHSSFMWHDKSNALFVNYQAKLKKSICLLSTMHSVPDVDTESPKRKPCVILFYNQNKVGVDCFDQMTRFYTTRSASRRWPLAVWGNILDIAAINAKVLFIKSDGKHISQRQFIFQLIKNLCNEPEPTVLFSDAIPAAYPTHKRRKCHGKSCNNATTCCTKPTCGTCSVGNSKVTFVKCKFCSS